VDGVKKKVKKHLKNFSCSNWRNFKKQSLSWKTCDF